MQSELLDRDATCRFFGGTRPINPATLYRGVRKGRYPKPVKVGPGSSRGYPNKWIVDHQGDDPVWVADLITALRQLPVEDWRGKHDEWLELLIACKHVGVTLADFTEWYVGDPHYADHADIIGRKWHSVVTKHGGALWRELSKRKIKLGQADNALVEVPLNEARTKTQHQPTRNPDARLNYICNKISENPTERALFSWTCLAAEIVHECKLKPSQIMNLIAGNAYPTPLRKTLGKEGIQRTIANAFRHVEEKYLAEPNGQKGD